MGDFEVIQRTKDKMFDAGKLLYQWNRSQSRRNRQMSEFLDSPKTKEFMEAIKEDLSNERKNVLPDNQIVTTIKGRINSKGKKNPDQVWMHPYLFLDFAMWINPKFKLQVIRFVYDQLIEHRHKAGDYYPMLCSALSKFEEVNYREVGRILNYVVFNDHERALRNQATVDQMNDLAELERDAYKYIEMGFVNTYEDFKDVMRKEWKKRHGKVSLELQE